MNKADPYTKLNTVLLSVIAFFGIWTFKIITGDHETLANHETRITVLEKTGKPTVSTFPLCINPKFLTTELEQVKTPFFKQGK